jgi:hypothetical protein
MYKLVAYTTTEDWNPFEEVLSLDVLYVCRKLYGIVSGAIPYVA